MNKYIFLINENKGIAIITSLYLLFSFISFNSKIIHLDEYDSHLPTTIQFFNENFITASLGPMYKSASTPLPYFLVSIPFKILNTVPAIKYVRLVNIIISFLTLFVFLKLTKGSSLHSLFFALILFFYPYFLKPSFAFFMAIYGLFFFLLFIYFVNKNGILSNFLSGLSLAFAILSQQFYLIVFCFYILFQFFNKYRAEKNIKSLKELLFFSMPISLPLILFFFWGGLTHPNYIAWGTNFQFENLTSVLVVLGGTLFPILIFKLSSLNKIKLAVSLLLSILLVIFVFPLWVNAPTVGGILGYTFHSLAIIDKYSTISAFIIKVVLCFLGIGSLLIFYDFKENNKTKFLYILFIIMVFGFSLNKLPSERHMLPLVTLGYLLAFSSNTKISILTFWLSIQIIIGSVYFYYIMFAYQVGG